MRKLDSAWIDRDSSSYVDVIRCAKTNAPLGSIKRGHNTRTDTCPDLYFAGVGEAARAVARVWPDGLAPETNPTPHIPYTTHSHALTAVVGGQA